MLMPIGSQVEKVFRRIVAVCRLAILPSIVIAIGITGAAYIKLQYVAARQAAESQRSSVSTTTFVPWFR